MSKINRRNLLRATAAGAAGMALSGAALDSVHAASQAQTANTPMDDALFGEVASATGSDSVGVQLDGSRAGAGLAVGPEEQMARPSVNYRQLREGDAVAVTRDRDGSLIASPLFVSLSGPIERYSNRQLTVQGRSCVIDDLSAVRDGAGERNLLTSLRPGALSVGRNVGVLCVNNRKSGTLTVQVLLTA